MKCWDVVKLNPCEMNSFIKDSHTAPYLGWHFQREGSMIRALESDVPGFQFKPFKILSTP